MSTQKNHCALNEKQQLEQDKVVSLFQFIKELNKLKQKTILNYKSYDWSCLLSDIPDDENIQINYRDCVNDESGESSLGNVLLSVHKPEFHSCPEPDKMLLEWLNPGWNDYRETISIKHSIVIGEKRVEPYKNLLDMMDSDATTQNQQTVFFEEDDERVRLLNEWKTIRDSWVEQQRISERTHNLFSDLYSWYFELQRESETKELIVANGIICDRDNVEIRHPVLTRRVKIDYDAEENTIAILDTDVSSELYSAVFQSIEDINLDGMAELSVDLSNNDYHPLDRIDTPRFLNVLTNQLSSESLFSNAGIPENWRDANRILLYTEPCFIVRKRLDGTLKAIEQIIENIQTTGEITDPIRDIVSGGTIDISDDKTEESLEEKLAAVGGESVDILLSKEANKEQLEIAKRIEAYNAVLVQGPPGTGKTHTIANLMGHFIAHGKSVLVTSHTKKALKVLKDKVAPGLRNLCVSILDDSNIDMERSVDGITEYMAKSPSYELKQEMDSIANERKEIIKALADVRKKIFAIINRECECIVYCGEEISPTAAAKFVVENMDKLSYIPGSVQSSAPLPLSFSQLDELYRSNSELSITDEEELLHDIPDPNRILDPLEFSRILKSKESANSRIESIANDNHWRIENNSEKEVVKVEGDFGTLLISYPELEDVEDLRVYLSSFNKNEEWMTAVAADGERGGSYRHRWEVLIEQIEETNSFAESIMTEQFGSTVQCVDSKELEKHENTFKALKLHFAEKGKIGKLALMMHKEYGAALEYVKINGKPIQSAKECNIVLNYIELNKKRSVCAGYWNELLGEYGVPEFFKLNESEPEQIARKWIPDIQKYLDWYAESYQPLLENLMEIGIDPKVLFMDSTFDSAFQKTNKILYAVENVIPAICDVLEESLYVSRCCCTVGKIKKILLSGKRPSSCICSNVVRAIEKENCEWYAAAYANLENMYEKYTLKSKREELIKLLKPVAPEWANAIENRQGIHGEGVRPGDIEDAWKWKQLNEIVQGIIEKPFSELQAESIRLSKDYRETTARYAEKSGWYHLLKRTETDINMKQALVGWKQTVKKIGKGTGKQAPALKKKARELMAQCQDAVPGWIMPINRALESLNPKENKFDVIIIDEASQSDISSLAILYMGKKLIIVGDDKQVSPMAVGVEVNKISDLEQMYIKDKIPNSHLYNAKTSIYDIAATTFQPLMLREHFRCVPEIIGFSNMLSYDYKIKPLRDASSSDLLPAVVNYRVKNGQRHEKANSNEAKAIVALMKACMEEPEYKNKSFGVISLLGDEQVRVISRIIEQEISPKEIKKRQILCGNSANFQGDERDVIFLSLVDSGTGNGPMKMQNYGADDTYRKRYNVAASRARDQLWVVDSLDSSADLKPGDIRKMLIDYSINPQASNIIHSELEAHSESPFEAAVATALTDRGYHLVQQWEVGAYRLDMVAVCGKKTVAVECDGEKWHSGEAKIREDMERQTILERLGWRFIRIRGSEYYRKPEETINRVISELTAYGIEPEERNVENSESRKTNLWKRVVRKAESILFGDTEDCNEKIIEMALNPKSVVPDNVPKEVNTKPLTVETTKQKTEISKTQRRKDNGGNGTDTKSNIPKPDKVEEPVNKTREKPEQIVMEGFESVVKSERRKKAAKREAKEVSESTSIIKTLEDYGFEYIDNTESSDIIWVISNRESKLQEEKVIQEIGYPYAYEKRGTLATNHRRAWRIMTKRKEK